MTKKAKVKGGGMTKAEKVAIANAVAKHPHKRTDLERALIARAMREIRK
jgi:hypothetical protein